MESLKVVCFLRSLSSRSNRLIVDIDIGMVIRSGSLENLIISLLSLYQQDVSRANADGRGSPAFTAAPVAAPLVEVTQDEVDQQREVPDLPPAGTKCATDN